MEHSKQMSCDWRACRLAIGIVSMMETSFSPGMCHPGAYCEATSCGCENLTIKKKNYGSKKVPKRQDMHE